MRAKLVDEGIGFERGTNPKKAMGIGGTVPVELYAEVTKGAFEKWKDFLEGLKGKKITGKFYPSFKKSAWVGDTDRRYSEITVKDVELNFSPDIKIRGNEKDPDPALKAAGLSRTDFYLDPDAPFYVE